MPDPKKIPAVASPDPSSGIEAKLKGLLKKQPLAGTFIEPKPLLSRWGKWGGVACDIQSLGWHWPRGLSSGLVLRLRSSEVPCGSTNFFGFLASREMHKAQKCVVWSNLNCDWFLFGVTSYLKYLHLLFKRQVEIKEEEVQLNINPPLLIMLIFTFPIIHDSKIQK